MTIQCLFYFFHFVHFLCIIIVGKFVDYDFVIVSYGIKMFDQIKTCSNFQKFFLL